MYAVGYRSASSYLANGLLVRGMVQEDLHNLEMTIRSSEEESHGPTATLQRQSSRSNYRERSIDFQTEFMRL